MKRRKTILTLSILLAVSLVALMISLVVNIVLLMNNKSSSPITSNVSTDLVGVWESDSGRTVEIFADGTVHWTYKKGGILQSAYTGYVDGSSFIFSKLYDSYGRGEHHSLSELPDAAFKDTHVIYDILMHGRTAFSAQNTNIKAESFVWSFTKKQ